MLFLVGAWSFATEKLLTLSEKQVEDCDSVDSACTVGSWILGFRLPKRTPRFTADSACHVELADFGFAFAVKSATVLLDTRVRARRPACGLAQGTGFPERPLLVMIPYSVHMLASTMDTVHSSVYGGFHTVSTCTFTHFMRESFFLMRHAAP